MSLGTVSSTCFPKTQPAGAGEIDEGRRTLYQSSFGSSGSFGSSFSLFRLDGPRSPAPAFGASSLSVVSSDFGFGARLHPPMSERAPLFRFIMALLLAVQ